MTETRERKIIRPEPEIKIPDNYLERIHNTLKHYKKWLQDDNKIAERADKAETEEEQQKILEERRKAFKIRYAGMLSKDTGERLSVSQIKKTWERFIGGEYRDFLKAHVNISMEDILRIGIDKFIYTMGGRNRAMPRLGTTINLELGFVAAVKINSFLCFSSIITDFAQTAGRIILQRPSVILLFVS